MKKKTKKKNWKKLINLSKKTKGGGTIKQMKQTVQDLKFEIEAIKKTQIKGIWDMENLGKQMGTTEANIANRMQEMEERISGVEDTIEQTDS